MPKESIITQIIIFASILFAAAAIVIISFIMLYQKRKHLHQLEIKQLEENFTKEMLHAQVEIKDETLRSIATEIHDNFNPTLSVININLAAMITGLPAEHQSDINETKTLVKQLMAEMKALSVSLNSGHLKQAGFYASLEQYVVHIQRSGMFKLSFSVLGERKVISPEKEIILFRICQEALNNIIKHAHASQIDIKVFHEPEFMFVEITDNGRGFDTQMITTGAFAKKNSTGIGNIKKRGEMLGAELNINSIPGKGTTIHIKFKP